MLWMAAECCCQISRHAGQGTGLFADADLDLAAIMVDAPTPFYATFDSSSLRLGEPLVALGYPVGDLFGNDPTVSEGRLTNTEQGTQKSKPADICLFLYHWQAAIVVAQCLTTEVC